MYVSFETYSANPYAVDMPEDEYTRYSELADMVLDSWTFHRAQQAFVRGEKFPKEAVALYCAVIASVPVLIENATEGATGHVVLTSFSNGVDDYSFEASDFVADELKGSLQWMIDALPVGWDCACIYPVGRCHHRNYYAC